MSKEKWEPIPVTIAFDKLEQMIRADEREKIAAAIERERDQIGMVAGANMSHGLLRAARIARGFDDQRLGA